MNTKLITLSASLLIAVAALATQAGTDCPQELTAWLHLALVPPIWHFCAAEIRDAAVFIFSEESRALQAAREAELAALRRELAGLGMSLGFEAETPSEWPGTPPEDENGFSPVTRAQKEQVMERIKESNKDSIFQNAPGARVYEFN
jgi:hypothetical protein